METYDQVLGLDKDVLIVLLLFLLLVIGELFRDLRTLDRVRLRVMFRFFLNDATLSEGIVRAFLHTATRIRANPSFL